MFYLFYYSSKTKYYEWFFFFNISIIFLWYICTVWQQQFKNEDRRGIWFLFLIMEMQSSPYLLSKWWLEAIYLSEQWTVNNMMSE